MTNNDTDFLSPLSEKKPFSLLSLAKKPWFILLASFLILMGVATFSINRIMIAFLHSRPEVIVPKLEGKSLAEALRVVSAVDLALQQEGTDFDEGLPAGTILRQHPPSGMQVRAGRSIRVIVSKGGQVMFVPEIVGKPLAEAQSLLASNGMQMGAVTEIYATDAAKGMVLSQNPPSGGIGTRGVLVDVEVSKGAPPAGAPLMPDFVGKQAEEVRRWAEGLGVSIKIKENPKALGAAGSVTKQKPSAGQPLLEGEEIHITVVPLSGGAGTRLNFQIPGEGDVTVRIMARDNRGESQIYEGKHKGGTNLEFPIGVSATTRVRIYVDDVLRDERVVEP